MELLSEEINAEVAMLAGLSRRRDSNDLTGTALEDQEVTNADMVARDRDGFGGSATALNVADRLMVTLTDAMRATLTILLLDNHLLSLMFRGEGVEHAVSGFLKAMTERVVMTFVVVVTHA